MVPDTHTLTDLGLSNLEAAIYYHLVQSQPVTGYQVARELGKPTANTYQAIEALRHKGAVIVDDSGDRLCRAVPPREFLNSLQRDFAGKRRRAERMFANLELPPADDGIYAIRSRVQVLERVHSMIRDSKKVVLLDIAPGFVEEFRSTIADRRGSGVQIAAKLYADARLPGARTFVNPQGQRVIKAWKGEWLNVIADGREFLTSFFAATDAEPKMAYWSPNNLLAWAYHSSLASEIALTLLISRIQDGADSHARADIVRAMNFVERLSTKTAPGAVGLSRKLTTVPEKQSKPKRRRHPKTR